LNDLVNHYSYYANPAVARTLTISVDNSPEPIPNYTATSPRYTGDSPLSYMPSSPVPQTPQVTPEYTSQSPSIFPEENLSTPNKAFARFQFGIFKLATNGTFLKCSRIENSNPSTEEESDSFEI
jgi:hypothetical protein